MSDYRKNFPELYKNKTEKEIEKQDEWLRLYDEHRKQKGMKSLCETRNK